MKVILLQDVEKLGKAGTVKEVKDGFGFNFLLPEGLADIASPGNMKQAERFIARRAKLAAEEDKAGKAAAQLIAGRRLTIKAKATDGKLFGSVGRAEIVSALGTLGITVGEETILLDRPFKELGTFSVKADLGHGARASFVVIVESE